MTSRSDPLDLLKELSVSDAMSVIKIAVGTRYRLQLGRHGREQADFDRGLGTKFMNALLSRAQHDIEGVQPFIAYSPQPADNRTLDELATQLAEYTNSMSDDEAADFFADIALRYAQSLDDQTAKTDHARSHIGPHTPARARRQILLDTASFFDPDWRWY